MSNFDNIFKTVSKAIEKDVNVSAHRAGDIAIKSHVPFGILTGIPELDFNIGRPGWPAGRCVELFGFEHCGKTTLSYHAIAEAQRMGGGGFFIDTEKSWDEDRAAQCGVDVNTRFGIIDAESVEGAFRAIQAIIDARKKNNDGSPFVIVIDSITGTATEFMKDHEIGKEERVGQDARAIRGGMRRITADLAATKINLFMINHAISTIPKFKFAKQSESAGGHAIKLLSSVRIQLASVGWIQDEDDKEHRLGQKIVIKVEKLKGSVLDYPVVKEVELLNTIGFNMQESLLKAGCKSGWIEHKEGSKEYRLGDEVFPSRDWPTIVLSLGGPQKAYRTFIDWCIEEGKMKPWSQAL